ncbi:MAG: iron-containing alcohol dehydrogenase [Desulfovibrio sp.]|uniref:iron-containing alcohol dehydrogenase n=1 Tax=Desulfovibrio sp. 7SRBS1 TaxID=3378064 RepID=UPI003B40A2FB
MEITKFAVPEIIFGNGSIKHLAPCARRLGAQRVLLVSDSGLEKVGWVDVVTRILAEDGLECVYFNEVDSNPRDWQVHKGAKIYMENQADVIIGLGGGSPIDAAKGIGTLVGNGGKISDYEGANRIQHPLPPMIFIPSTGGSGSDVTQYSIITDVARQVKMSIISRTLVPNISIIDPSLLVTMTRELIIASGVDAFSHAIESYLSKLASPFTENQALMAMRLILENLGDAIQTKNPKALEKLSIASTAAGMSFSNAGLGITHALAHSLGGRFDVMHGMVHPVLLPVVMRYNIPACTEKLANISRTIMKHDKGTSEELAHWTCDHLTNLFAGLDVPVRLRELIPDKSSLDQICRMALYDACAVTNPRYAAWSDLMSICRESW